ncbi:DNA mismatch repair endonuclease MutL [bacterium BFN5]|nr:DNA mismatch repair endonuclease MutL [bacterium BFN5]
MTTIHVLDENTANKIAAGEVVERPAAIIKELVENAIDAQSTKIEVEIGEGGTSFIRVTDDGIGMSYEDANLSILRHATSKIRIADDLTSIGTLGFRGEALPTIASVSKFSLTTRLHDQHFATFLAVHGGITTDVRESGGNVGTTVTVEDLFYNTPARKKFLKKPAAESAQIHNILVKLALSHPGIAFKLINNNRLVLSTPGNNQLLDTLGSLYGNDITNDLLPVYFNDEDIEISGFLSKPTILKSSRQWQTYLINSRIVNSRIIAKALDNAYHSLLPKSGYPLAVLNIILPLSTIDVNVHPQKSEVKFSDDNRIFKSVYRSVTDTLRTPLSPSQIAATVTPKLPFVSATGFTPSTYSPHHNDQYTSTIQKQQPLFLKEDPVSISAAQSLIAREIPLNSLKADSTDCIYVQDEPANSTEFTLTPLGQIDNCYIIAYNQDGMFIIDQHAAHERILYDRLGASTERIPVQQLLVPLFIDFDDTECTMLLDNQPLLHQLGFSLELVGPCTMRLLEVPADIPISEAEQIIKQILQSIHELHQPTSQELRHAFLQITACRAAIKAGDTLNMRQIQALIGELCQTTLPFTCPHGRPSIIKFSTHDLAKMFKRT